MAANPHLVTAMRENRAAMRRAAAFLAGDQGIRQFLDIGTGLPTSPNLHEVVQAVAPDARVVHHFQLEVFDAVPIERGVTVDTENEVVVAGQSPGVVAGLGRRVERIVDHDATVLVTPDEEELGLDAGAQAHPLGGRSGHRTP